MTGRPEIKQGGRRDGRRNLRTVVLLLGMFGGMVVLVSYSVPLYRLFCQVTGYGGTTQRADAAPAAAGERVITIQFNADVNRGLPWKFAPEQREVKVRIGEQALAFYRATNVGSTPITGTATFNVTPAKAGPYFDKVECFCFTEQRLAAGESADMPVSFFIDPDIVEDRNLDEVETITLSYTFFRDPDAEASETAQVEGDVTTSVAN